MVWVDLPEDLLSRLLHHTSSTTGSDPLLLDLKQHLLLYPTQVIVTPTQTCGCPTQFPINNSLDDTPRQSDVQERHPEAKDSWSCRKVLRPEPPKVIQVKKSHTSPSENRATFDFFHWLGNCKTTKRTGWLIEDIPGPESIADHMYRMAVILLCIGQGGHPSTFPKYDISKAIQLALVHDMGECMVGDIPPRSCLTKERKHRLEEDAIEQLSRLSRSVYPDAQVGDSKSEDAPLSASSSPESITLADLWYEYETQRTPEAILVKDVDRFEMILQAYEYEVAHGTRLDSFFASTEGVFKTDLVRSWSDLLRQERACIL